QVCLGVGETLTVKMQLPMFLIVVDSGVVIDELLTCSLHGCSERRDIEAVFVHLFDGGLRDALMRFIAAAEYDVHSKVRRPKCQRRLCRKKQDHCPSHGEQGTSGTPA